MSEYPEHDKLRSIKGKSQAIGEFLTWLNGTKKIYLAVHLKYGEMAYTTESIKDLLAEFFEIDQAALENEKRAMLERLRKEQQ